MQISLRKANAIQIAINEALKGLEFKAEISINEFQDPANELDNALAKFNNNVSRRYKLIAALYDIRNKVAEANSKNSIDGLLAELARLEKDIVFLSPLVKSNTRTDLKVIAGKLEKIANRTEDSYYAKAEVESSIFTDADLEKFRVNLSFAKKAKQKLQDQLLELNVRTTIELSTETVATLTSEDIL